MITVQITPAFASSRVWEIIQLMVYTFSHCLSTYNMTREFDRRFEEIHHSLICKDLLKTYLSTTEGYRYAVEPDLFDTKCPVFVKDAVILLENL